MCRILILFSLIIYRIDFINASNVTWRSVHELTASEYIQITDNYIDNQGNMYISGVYSGVADFGNGSIMSNEEDGFLLKFNEQEVLIWQVVFSGKGSQSVSDIIVDTHNNVDIIGVFYDSLIINEVKFGSEGKSDSYLAQINGTNGQLNWIKQIRGSQENVANEIILDKDENILISGYYKDTLYFDAYSSVCRSLNNFDAFIAKVSKTGVVNWLQKAGGEQFTNVFINGLAVNTDNQILLCGDLIGSPLFGQILIEEAAYNTQYMAKLDANGTFLKVKKIGVNRGGEVIAIGLNSLNEVYLTGYFGYTSSSETYIDTFKLKALGGYSDWYVAKLDTSWTVLWARIGGSIAYQDYPTSLVMEGDGSVVVAGWLGGDKGIFDSDTLYSAGSQDIVILKYKSDGTLLWIKGAGGVEEDESSAISKYGNSYLVSGYFTSTCNFDSLKIEGNIGATSAYFALLQNDNLNTVKNTSLSNLELYPNPSNDVLYWNGTAPAQVSIYSSSGKLILENNIIDNCIKINNLDKGIYIISLYSNDKIQTGMFIKY